MSNGKVILEGGKRVVNTKVRVQVVFLLLLIGMPFFFFGYPEHFGGRSFFALWDLGHVLFFALASWLFCTMLRYHRPGVPTPLVQVYVFLAVLVLLPGC